MQSRKTTKIAATIPHLAAIPDELHHHASESEERLPGAEHRHWEAVLGRRLSTLHVLVGWLTSEREGCRGCCEYVWLVGRCCSDQFDLRCLVWSRGIRGNVSKRGKVQVHCSCLELITWFQTRNWESVTGMCPCLVYPFSDLSC